MKIQFREFFLFEDLATDVLQLQNQIALIQGKKARTVKPIDDQLVRLQQLLVVKQKQLGDQKAKETKTASTSTSSSTQQTTSASQPGSAPQ